jgi:hypothetical protein
VVGGRYRFKLTADSRRQKQFFYVVSRLQGTDGILEMTRQDKQDFLPIAIRQKQFK